MPRIALNCRFSGTAQPTGAQVAAFQIFNAILQESQDFDFVVFGDSRFQGIRPWQALTHVHWKEVPFQDWSRGRAQLWEQLVFPVRARREGCDIAHHPMATCPFWHNGIRQVVTLLDLNFFLHREWYSPQFRLVYSINAIPGLKVAHRVVAISAYVRDQAAQYLHIRKDRLRHIYLGAKPLAMERPPDSGDYLLCVGSLQPHKNLARLICAYHQISPEFPGLELRVVGRQQPHFSMNPELAALLTSPGVRLLGYLTDTQLASAYAGARAFCFPSLEEGFGMPVLEAMLMGTPVLTSNRSCLPEIAGPALQVDPTSEAALADGLRALLRLSPAERASLAVEGQKWAAGFSWSQAANQYLRLYHEVASM